MKSTISFLLICTSTVKAATYSLATTGNRSAQLDPAPVGVSLEFFTFPAYMNDVASTAPCLAHLKDVMGSPAPVRIGGTTQDRATYDPASSAAVTYTVASPSDAPASLTFGPSFMTLASKLEGQTTIGFNRRLNNLNNTIAAAVQAKSVMKNLYSIELGNEPDLFSSSDPIATTGAWNPSIDATSQISWQQSVSNALSTKNIIQAGVYLQPPTWSTANLAPKEVSANAAQYVKSFSGHLYPQTACGGASTNLPNLMKHSGTVSYTARFRSEAAAANAIGKDYHFAETNSATCGGGGISPTFGAALWIVDYVMQAMLIGAKQLFFHQGTLGNCQYCWWGRYSMGAPYYGAYFVAKALGGADTVAMLDDGTTNYAAYVIYKGNAAVRLLLINTDYYASGTRPTQPFQITNLPSSTTSVTAERLTAAFATSRQDQGGIPTVGGLSFKDGTCAITGTQSKETTAVSGGVATFTVGASEALLVTL